MNCINCQFCLFPRTADDNNGACKCAAMQYKTIDVYVSGGETPDWCPLIKQLNLSLPRDNEEIKNKANDYIDRILCVVEQLDYESMRYGPAIKPIVLMSQDVMEIIAQSSYVELHHSSSSGITTVGGCKVKLVQGNDELYIGYDLIRRR